MLIDSPTTAPALFLQEKPKPRTRRFWQRRPNDAEILRRAVDVLDERGWTRGSWVSASSGKVCLLGAIGVAALDSGMKFHAPNWDFENKVMSAADRVVGHGHGLHGWNDVRARDVGDVKRKLEELAQKADANGGKYPRG